MIDLEPSYELFGKIKTNLTPWGVGPNHKGEYAGAICCPDCEWQAFNNGVTLAQWSNAVVGFTRQVLVKADYKYLGTLFFDCPKCNKRFWLHLRGQWLDNYVLDCEKWPEKDREFLRGLGVLT